MKDSEIKELINRDAKVSAKPRNEWPHILKKIEGSSKTAEQYFKLRALLTSFAMIVLVAGTFKGLEIYTSSSLSDAEISSYYDEGFEYFQEDEEDYL